VWGLILFASTVGAVCMHLFFKGQLADMAAEKGSSRREK
jgi:hypothetical protein